jgi:tetratricopeptide (TPR) repeat protein
VYLNHLGLIAWEREDFERAGTRYKRAMDAALAQSYGQIGGNELQVSEEDAYAQAMEGRALALYRQDQHLEAARLFDCLATMFPEAYASCRYLQGEALHAAGEVSSALDAYETAPVEPGLLYNRGLARWQAGQHMASVRDLLRGISANPHIAGRVLESADDGRPSDLEPNLKGREAEQQAERGYLSSTHYAQDYLEACMSLWDRQSAQMPREILGRCLTNNRARQFLSRSSGGGGVEAAAGGRQQTAGGSSERVMPPDDLARGILADLGHRLREDE